MIKQFNHSHWILIVSHWMLIIVIKQFNYSYSHQNYNWNYAYWKYWAKKSITWKVMKWDNVPLREKYGISVKNSQIDVINKWYQTERMKPKFITFKLHYSWIHIMIILNYWKIHWLRLNIVIEFISIDEIWLPLTLHYNYYSTINNL